MHWDSLKYSQSSVRNVLLHIGFILPLVLTTLWIRPLTREPLTQRIYRNMTTPLMTEAQFETMRLYLILLSVVFRLAVMPTYLQVYSRFFVALNYCVFLLAFMQRQNKTISDPINW